MSGGALAGGGGAAGVGNLGGGPGGTGGGGVANSGAPLNVAGGGGGGGSTTLGIGNGYGYFVIVHRDDCPLYSAEFGKLRDMGPGMGEAVHPQFVAHASLDLVEELIWKQKNMYLKVVDRFGDRYLVSAFVAPSNTRFLLVHDSPKNDEAVRTFFTRVYELYVKTLLNPLYSFGGPIQSPLFDARVKHYAQELFSQNS